MAMLLHPGLRLPGLLPALLLPLLLTMVLFLGPTVMLLTEVVIRVFCKGKGTISVCNMVAMVSEVLAALTA